MSKSKHAKQDRQASSQQAYKERLHDLQVELVKLQRHFIAEGEKILVLVEGRDTAGKDGVIKRIIQHLSPRETRVVALGPPSDRERDAWYFQRFVSHLPSAGEFVLFNRSWYNRAGVERVMGFCNESEYEGFMETVVPFEHMLIRSGIKLMKYYLDIDREEQAKRLEDRRHDPLKQWKISPIDARAQALWPEYSEARDAMLARTHDPLSPWTIVRAEDKRTARLNLITDLLTRLHYDDKIDEILRPDPEIVFKYDRSYHDIGMIAP